MTHLLLQTTICAATLGASLRLANAIAGYPIAFPRRRPRQPARWRRTERDMLAFLVLVALSLAFSSAPG